MLIVDLGPVTVVQYVKRQKDKFDIVCGNNEKYQILYWKAVFLLPKKCEDWKIAIFLERKKRVLTKNITSDRI